MQNTEKANCNDCSWLFTEYDDEERRYVSWCTYNTHVTRRMYDMSERGFRCPKETMI